MSMEPNRQHDSGLFPRQKSFLPRAVVLSRSAPKAISGANEDRWGEPGPQCYNRTPINGWAPFQVRETAITEKKCDTPCKLSRRTRQHLRFPSPASSCASMDCMAVPLTPTGPVVRLLVATHPAGDHQPAIGVVRKETVYELFYTTLPPHAFTASDVLQVYLHRGSFETVHAARRSRA